MTYKLMCINVKDILYIAYDSSILVGNRGNCAWKAPLNHHWISHDQEQTNMITINRIRITMIILTISITAYMGFQLYMSVAAIADRIAG